MFRYPGFPSVTRGYSRLTPFGGFCRLRVPEVGTHNGGVAARRGILGWALDIGIGIAIAILIRTIE